MLQLNTPVNKVSGIGKKYQKKLENLNIKTVGDLLYYFPYRYDDFSEFKKIDQIKIGETITIQGRVVSLKTTQARYRRLTITEAYVEDDTGSIKVVWFNSPLPLQNLREGRAIRLSGKVGLNKQQEAFLSHPNFEFIPLRALQREQSETIIQVEEENSSCNTGILAPIYHETGGLNSFWFRRIIKNILSQVAVEEFIPQSILKSQKLTDLAKAFRYIHFPQSQEEINKARERFAFEKIFLIQLKSFLAKATWNQQKAPAIPFNEEFIKDFVQNLPFQLTNAQKKATWQIIQDLSKDKPMNRLLEGDVGTGKTVVSAIAALSVVNQLYQVALLAPTEVLAVQHYKSLRKFFRQLDFSIGLLTRSESQLAPANRTSVKISRPKLLEQLKKGQVDILIGTHAIIQKSVTFNNLGLVIIDEQHRFGVKQRAFLQENLGLENKKNNLTPHLLSMTATPIPRSLSLTMFGNLDLSVIDEFPKGRKKIITKIVPQTKLAEVHHFIKKAIKNGRQAFVIFPLVNESSKMSEVKAATAEHQRLQKEIFPEFKLGLLHGKMKPKEKNQIMADFKNKKLDILISTSVVEVGVDVPNANIMLIEGAERFGLAQLHQFRGRVGRGEHQSYCFLSTSGSAPETTSRLRILEQTNDGFKIAQADLQLRGPGQFMGTAQSGLPDIAMESLSDLKTIEQARQEAQRLVHFDPQLKKFPRLKKELERLNIVTHWE